MDATTVLAVICSAIVFAGWLVLPHSATTKVKVAAVVSEERTPVPVSA
ncbi:MAG TPA: hypothetical protein VHK65_02350 [Candidatus Dormibacteraeota bacterium]|nr:hypothetical protein [Candidatus Dormibacteraeota bacterium]